MPVLENNQNEYNFYLNQLTDETSGNIRDLENKFLETNLSETNGQTTDMWIEYLQANGASSDNILKAWVEFLRSKGYTVTNLQDTINQYFKDNS